MDISFDMDAFLSEMEEIGKQADSSADGKSTKEEPQVVPQPMPVPSQPEEEQVSEPAPTPVKKGKWGRLVTLPEVEGSNFDLSGVAEKKKYYFYSHDDEKEDD